MKKLLLGSIALVALSVSGAALAADLKPVYKAPPPPPVYFSWTGCYIGGHVGYHRSSYDQHLSFDDVTSGAEFRFTHVQILENLFQRLLAFLNLCPDLFKPRLEFFFIHRDFLL